MPMLSWAAEVPFASPALLATWETPPIVQGPSAAGYVDAPGADLTAWGFSPSANIRAALERALGEVVRPAAHALLTEPSHRIANRSDQRPSLDDT